jgi:hypothetical protein
VDTRLNAEQKSDQTVRSYTEFGRMPAEFRNGADLLAATKGDLRKFIGPLLHTRSRSTAAFRGSGRCRAVRLGGA